VVSSGAGINFHSFTASWQGSTSKGWPPTTRLLLTRPSGVITTSILTLPLTFMRRASSGYIGAVLDLIFSLVSSAEPDCAAAEAPEKTTTAVAASTRFLSLLVLMDTTPRGNLDYPTWEKARVVPRRNRAERSAV